jgi:hypothetical protein
MPVKFDSETLQRFRGLSPHEVYTEVIETVRRSPETKGSEDFLDALDALVDEGILTWDQIENFEDTEDN